MNTKIKLVISDKSYPIPIEMRPIWRICLIIISIITVSGNKKYLDMKKVNILVWMLIRKSKWNEYEEYLLDRLFKIPLISVDTATYKAVEFSIAKEFVELKNSRLYITEKGEYLFSILVKSEIMTDERFFLQQIGKKLTNNKINELTGKLR